MDINVNLNINLDLSERMVRLLRQNMPEDLPEHCCDDFDKRVSDICLGIIKQLSKHAHPEENSGTEEISDATLREKVKEAKDRTDTKTVRALFAEFGINILDISQTIMQGYFTMMMIVDLDGCGIPFMELSETLSGYGNSRGLSIRIQREDTFDAMNQL